MSVLYLFYDVILSLFLLTIEASNARTVLQYSSGNRELGSSTYGNVLLYLADANSDGKVTAADARLALRTSARLESLDSLSYSAADVDGKSGVTASDARLILRKAAHLD